MVNLNSNHGGFTQNQSTLPINAPNVMTSLLGAAITIGDNTSGFNGFFNGCSPCNLKHRFLKVYVFIDQCWKIYTLPYPLNTAKKSIKSMT